MGKIIDYKNTLAWRCPQCGKLALDRIELFDFSGREKIRIICDCGFNKLTAGKKKNNDYWLEYFCIFCDSKHVNFYKSEEFWSHQIKEIKCPINKTELGYLGGSKEVEKIVAKEEEYLQQMMEKLEVENYLKDYQTKGAMMRELNELVKDSGLGCQCGNQDVEVKLTDEGIRLICKECNSLIKVTSNIEGVDSLRKLKKIKILEGVVKALKKTHLKK